MAYLWDREHDSLEQQARDSLLRYYSSECTVHGSYILTLVLAIFAFFQAINNVPFVEHRTIITTVGLTVFITIGIYLVARELFWGTMTSFVIYIPAESLDETKRMFKIEEAPKLMIRFHCSCIKAMERTHPVLCSFVGMRRTLIGNGLLYLLLAVFVYFILEKLIQVL